MQSLDLIKRVLEERLRSLSAKTGKIEDELRTARSADWEEQATEVEGDEVLGALETTLLTEIEEIRNALHRIEDGNYGECTTCDENIGEQRLEALPYATQCISCAQSRKVR